MKKGDIMFGANGVLHQKNLYGKATEFLFLSSMSLGALHHGRRELCTSILGV